MKGPGILPFFFSLALIFSSLLATPVFAGDHLHVFIYHRFGDNRYPSTNISLENFSGQMRFLRDHGYRVIRAGEAVDLLRQNQPIPDKTVVLTVDDAYATFKSEAMPILRQYGFPVTLFVNTDSVGGEGYLGWNDLRELSQAGVEIGNHTATHRSMADQLRGETLAAYRQRLHTDLDRAQQTLRRELGHAPQLFAYPYGEYTQLSRKMVEDYGFQGAFAQHSGVIGRADHLFALPRTPLTGSYATLSQMEQKLALRPLPVKIIAPDDTLIGEENPPTLTLESLDPQLDLQRLRLFVDGAPGGIVQRDPRHGERMIVRASKALGAGRHKYILTLPGKEAGTFYGFTQFWLNRSRP